MGDSPLYAMKVLLPLINKKAALGQKLNIIYRGWKRSIYREKASQGEAL